MRRAVPLLAAPALAVFALAAAALPAAAQTCGDLWFQRNAIFKAAGYCFRTPRAIAEFGNAGCRFDSEDAVPLSNADRREVQAIRREEAAQGCR